MSATDDPYDLNRFLSAQQHRYQEALAEIRGGQKTGHWMWYIFPQFAGLGHSETARYYAIKSLPEARAYLAHPVLGSRLREVTQAVLALRGRTASQIFPYPDALKLHSCATLFARISPPGSPFHQLIETYFNGQPAEDPPGTTWNR